MEKEYTLFNLSFLVVVGLILIVLSASISYIIATRVVFPKDIAANEEDPIEFTGLVTQIGSFTTDLRDNTNRTRVVRVEIAVEVTDKKAIDQIAERKIPIQDKIITILRSKTADELKGDEGKNMLAEELQKGMEELLSYRIVNVYFNEFIVQ